MPASKAGRLEAEDAYLAHLDELAQAVLQERMTRDEALGRPLPAARAGLADPHVLADNLAVLLRSQG